MKEDCIKIKVKVTNLDKLDELNEKLAVTAELLDRIRIVHAEITVDIDSEAINECASKNIFTSE